jgi:hypothetical protein
MARRLLIPEKLAAGMTPAVRAFVESLLKRISELEALVQQLQAQAGKTPRKSSLPPAPSIRTPSQFPKNRSLAENRAGSLAMPSTSGP